MKIVTGKFCMPCKMLKDYLNQNDIHVDEVYADEEPELVERLGIKQTPTLVLDDDTIISGLDSIEEYFENE